MLGYAQFCGWLPAVPGAVQPHGHGPGTISCGRRGKRYLRCWRRSGKPGGGKAVAQEKLRVNRPLLPSRGGKNTGTGALCPAPLSRQPSPQPRRAGAGSPTEWL